MRFMLPSLALVLSMALAACHSAVPSDPPRAEAPRPAPEPEPEPEQGVWPEALECVATYQNPSLSTDGARAADALGAALDEAGIRWISAGSRGFSLNVDVKDAERARALIGAVIAAQGVEAWVYPPDASTDGR